VNWWNGRRALLAAVAASVLAALAFVLRFNALGGAIGGFDNDHFIYLARTDAMLDGAQPLRDFVDAELRGAWPALTYAVSAWAQQLGGRVLYSEALLTVGALAAAHAAVFVLALDLSRRWWVAALAAALTIATVPKLYNYPKILALVLGAWALRAVVLKPSTARLVMAAIVTAVAVLFRHDLGLYVAAGVAAALLARDFGQWRAAMRSVAVYASATAVCLLPSVVWVHTYGGLPQYLRDAAASVAVERARTNLRLPRFDVSAPLSVESLELVTYYAFWAVPIIALAAVAASLVPRTGFRLSREERATAIGLLAMTVLANASMLRANLAERFGDAAPAVALLAAWTGGSLALASSPGVRRAALFLTAVPLAAAVAASYVFSDIHRELQTTGMSLSWRETARRYAAVRDALGRLPPTAWSDADTHGILVAARYVSECTTAGDRLLTIGPVHEIPVFARRRFAAGQAMFKLSLYTSEAFQRRALARLAAESVPIAIADAAEFREFTLLYPLVAQHLAERYREAGSIAVDGAPRFKVFVAADRRPTGLHPALGLPCFARDEDTRSRAG
jgi:hypothetical protein